MTSALMLLAKASLLLAAAFVARRVLRAGPAARRHGLWSAAFAGLLALPLLILALPPLDLPVLSGTESTSTPLPSVGMTPVEDATLTTQSSDVAPSTDRVTPSEPLALARSERAGLQLPTLGTTLLVTWLMGAVAALIAILVSFARVRRLESAGVELVDATWRAARARVAARLGYGESVRIVACEGIRTPMAGGLVRATVFVPKDASAWDDQRRDIVLAHEIAHLASRDPLRNLVSRLACTLYWFHPLVWIAVRESAADCEQACDERVLSLGVRPSTYADLLLDFAAGPILNPKVAVPMVRRARLEQRLMSILENRHRPVARRTIVPACVAVALILSVAAARPVAREPGQAAVLPTVPTAVPTSVPKTISTARSNATSEARSETQLETRLETPLRPRSETPLEPRSETPSAPVLRVVAPECWGAEDRSGSFSGEMSTTGFGIREQIGRRGRERVLQSSFSDLRICAITEGFDGERDDRPSLWLLRSDRVILETRAANEVRTMDINDGRVTFTINNELRPLDARAQEWKTNLLALMDASWDLSQLRGRVSSMRGEISSIYGERSSLEGQISSYRGHVSSLNGEISSLRGQVSSMRGEISSIRGQESSMRGQIASERGSIASLRGMSWERARDIDVDARIRRHEENIRKIEQEIRDYDADARVREMERRIEQFDVERKVADVERQIREYDVEAKIARIRKEIAALDVESRVNGIEGEIRSTDYQARGRDLEQRRDEALARLRRTLGGR